MMPNIYCYLTIGFLLAYGSASVWAADEQPPPNADAEADGADQLEPAFPSLMDAASRPRIHITSESFDAHYGYETIEEFVDLELGKATWTSSSKQGHRTTLIDSSTQTIYRYKPYTCLMLKQSELISAGETGVWSKLVKVYSPSSSSSSSGDDERELHLFEVAAVWMNAAELPKSYSRSSVVYSSGKDIFRPAHRWTIKNGPAGLVHLYFIEGGSINSKAAADGGPTSGQLSLEMIQEELDGKIKRTINVLSIDYYIAADIYETLLQVPLGYGCRPDQRPAEFAAKQRLIEAAPAQRPNRLRMEATATKLAATEADTKPAASDTVSLDLLVKEFDAGSEASVQMVRQRNSQRDLKVISDYLLRVQYSIDLRRGSCELSHASSWKPEADKFSLNFNNGLQIGLDWPILVELFGGGGGDDDDGQQSSCQLIKITGRGRPVEFLFEECRGDKVFKGQRPARIMKKYSLKREADDDEEASVSLESLTVWVLDEQLNANQILESYHFYIVEQDLIEDRLELARLFDVSEECYLNNAQMRYGHDYAWTELHYPLSGRQLELLAEHERQLKERILQQFRLFFDSLIRMPRVELQFGETSVVVRLLLLDEPSPLLMWDSYPQRALVSSDGGDGQQGGLLQEITVDAQHCADLCRLQGCQALSYCANNYACLLRSERLKLTELDGAMRRADAACTAYAPAPQTKESTRGNKLRTDNLHYVLARLQHEDLADLELPEMPEELLYPQSSSGLSDEELLQRQAQYLIAVYKKLDEQDKLLPTLAMMFSIEGSMFFMVPSRFELEQNPLAELAANQDEDENEDQDRAGGQLGAVAAAFHEGLPLFRYKLSAFRDDNNKAAGDAHQYLGLSYDQCALACADGRCSSFSYCKHRQDCTITNIFSLEEARRDQKLVEDTDCFVAQRNFLQKFNQFNGVLRPAVYKRTAAGHNAAECAHTCVVETDFNCLAFDFCQTGPVGGQCYYLDSRLIYTGSSGTAPPPPPPPAGRPNETGATPTETGCSHFSRSYLAEFARIAHREVNPMQLAKLRTSLFQGRSIDRCADICLNDLADCTAFQFCFNGDSPDNSEGGLATARQQCTMIESRPEGAQTARDFRLVQDKEGNIIEQGKFFDSSVDCHVFALRRDTSEAQMRQVALEPLTPAEAKARADLATRSRSGLTLGGAFLLYLTSTALFAALGCALVLAKHRSSYVSDRWDRLKALLGYY